MEDAAAKPAGAGAERAPSPEVRAPFVSRLLMLWIVPMVFRGWRTPLEDGDLPELRDEERGAYTSARLRASWGERRARAVAPRFGRLASAVFANHRGTLLFTGTLKAVDVVLAAVQPVLINRLLVFLRSPEKPIGQGYLFSVLLFVMPLLKTLVENHYFLKTMRSGMRVRSALQGLLYDKSLSMSPSARASATTGEVVNLMQLDSQRASDFFQFAHVLWGAPVQIIVTVVLLFVYIGPSAVFGLVITFLTIPLQGKLMSVAIRLRQVGVGITDTRVKMMNEVLQGIKAVKFYAWEQPFTEKVSDIRQREVDNLGKTVVVRSGFITVMMIIPTLIAVVTFSFFSGVFKNDLDPARVFTGIALLNQLRAPVMMLPMVITAAIDAKLSIKRIQRFLLFDDIDNYTGRPDPFAGADSAGGAAAALEKKAALADHTSDDDEWTSTSHPTRTATATSESDGSSSAAANRTRPAAGGAAGRGSARRPRTGSAAAHVEISHASFGWGQPSGSIQGSPKDPNAGGLLSKCLPGKKGKKKDDAEGKGKGEDEADSQVPSDGEAAAASSAQVQQAASAPAPKAPFLNDLSLSIRGDKLCAVVGRVGSGKTSLVNAILGEMKILDGSVSVDGSIAYVAQSAWIFNDTLRNNVLFGKPYDEALYKRAIDVSALGPDISILPSGDLTAIGEKGINLSGGQKQRVSIARAVYADADMYIFDDPLSALDSHVGQSVFDKCISAEGKLHDRLRIFVTNQLQLLPRCDQVVFMDKGSVRGVGTYDDLMEDPVFRQLAEEVQKSNEDDDDDDENADGADNTANAGDLSKTLTSAIRDAESQTISVDGVRPSSQHVDKSVTKDVDEEEADEEGEKNDGKKLIQDEEREKGNVLLRAYYRYAVACGGVFVFFLILMLFVVSVALSVIVNWWLVYWSNETAGLADGESRRVGFFLGIYFGLGVLYAVLTFLRSVWFLKAALKASDNLHVRMLNSVLRAPMSFFDTTPIGRIISRFSRDVNAIDQLLPQAFSQMLSTVLNLVASYVYIATVFPWFVLVAVPVTALYYGLQRFYNRTSIELKRLDSISKSPIYAGFSETLGGLSTIRAYNKQLQFRNENMEKIDINQRAFFSTLASNRWFSLYLEVFGALLVFATALLAVISRASGNDKSASAIGLSLTYALQVTGILGFTIRSITELELQMNSVERLGHYGTKLEQEAPAVIEDSPVKDKEWPSDGHIVINNAQMRYREGLDLVLKGITLDIKPGEKVGVVGRTGSGKSSLMLVLLRLVELAGGDISIDGENLANLGLDDVRSKITIIPQDPVLFSGTVRFNLDPFGVYSEPELWDALAKSHLKEYVMDFEGGLDAMVTEYGENLSAGQKQLICLTRALLRKSKVLIMDEASSSLDYETDRLLQESIQVNMADATILMIAHRLWTLTKCNKILVMNDGLAAEFGAPETLLADPRSELRFLVDAMGADGATRFRELVDEAARRAGRL